MPRGLLRFIILRLLHERPSAGAEVASEILARSRGAWRPSPGSLYPALGLLRQSGHITEVGAFGGVKRYTLTDAGRSLLSAHLKSLSLRPPWLDLLSTFPASGLETDPGSADLWEGWRQMIQSIGQIADAVSVRPGLGRRAREILDQAAGTLRALATTAEDRVGGPVPGAAPDTPPGATAGAASSAIPDKVGVPAAEPDTAVSNHSRPS